MQAKEVAKSGKEEDTSVSVHLWDDRIPSTHPVTPVLEGKPRQCLCTALDKFR